MQKGYKIVHFNEDLLDAYDRQKNYSPVKGWVHPNPQKEKKSSLPPKKKDKEAKY